MLLKKKYSKRIKSLLGFIMVAFIIASVLSIAVSAETFLPDTKITMPEIPEMSDMMPSGTNIPDSNIGGAVENTSPIENMIPDNNDVSVPHSDLMGERSADSPEAENTLSRVLGIVIAVIVVLAVILLIVALIPKRAYDSRNRED